MSPRAGLFRLLLSSVVGLPILLAVPASSQTCIPGAPSAVPCLPVGEPSASPSASPSGSPATSGHAAESASSPSRSTTSPIENAETVPHTTPTGGTSNPLTDGVVTVPTTDPVTAPLIAPTPAPEKGARASLVVVAAPGQVAQSVSGAFALILSILLALPLLLALLASRLARTQPVATSVAPGRLPSGHLAAASTRAAGMPPLTANAVAAATAQAVATTVSAMTARPTTRSLDQPRSTAGDPMNPSGNRLYLGLGALAVAALAGFIGWYQLSANPNVNEQLPYLASAGVTVVIASAVGGALLVADQMRRDDRRIEELEEAVRELAAALSPIIEAPARRPVDEVPDTRIAIDDIGGTDVVDEAPTRVVRRPRAAV